MSSDPSLKKRRCDVVISTMSLSAYLLANLEDVDFDSLKIHISREHADLHPFVKLMDDLMEEMFKYLYLLVEHSTDDYIEISPSAIVDKALHCLLLNPVLYYRICDSLMNLRGHTKEAYPVRVLPHNPLGGDDVNERSARRVRLRVAYEQTFKKQPSCKFWPEPDFIVNYAAVEPSRKSGIPGAVVSDDLRPASASSDNHSKPLCIRLRDGGEDTYYFKLKQDTLLVKLFEAYAQRRGIAKKSLRFMFGGNKLHEKFTCAHYELEDNDQIDVMIEAIGC